MRPFGYRPPCDLAVTSRGADEVNGSDGGVSSDGVFIERSQSMGCGGSKPSHGMSTPSHGNPPSTSALNTELNNVARNTDDTAKARALVARGADLSSTNGPSWRHTPLHQASYHGRYEMARTLVELGAPLHLHSNPCGRGQHGTPPELDTSALDTALARLGPAAAKLRASVHSPRLASTSNWYAVERLLRKHLRKAATTVYYFRRS